MELITIASAEIAYNTETHLTKAWHLTAAYDWRHLYGASERKSKSISFIVREGIVGKSSG